MICNNCPKNCIEERSTLCLAYEGEDFGTVKCGDSINSVLQKLSGETVTSASSTPAKINTYTYAGASECSSNISNAKFTYKISNNTAGYHIDWNMSGIISPYKVVSYSVSSAAGTYSDAIGTFTFNSTKIPLTIDFKVRLSTTCGDIELSKTIIAGINTGEFTANFVIKDVNNAPKELSQDQAIDALFAEIASLKQQVDFYQATDSEAKLASFDKDLAEVKATDPLAEVTYRDQNVDVTTSVSDAFTSIFTLARLLEVQVNLNKAEIVVIKTQLSNIPSIVIE